MAYNVKWLVTLLRSISLIDHILLFENAAAVIIPLSSHLTQHGFECFPVEYIDLMRELKSRISLAIMISRSFPLDVKISKLPSNTRDI